MHVDLLAGDVARERRHQKAHRIGDVLRLAHAAVGHDRIEFVNVLHARRRHGEARSHIGFDETGRDDIHVDAVPALLVRQRESERLHRGFRHAVGRAVRGHFQGRDARDHHDVAARTRAHGGDQAAAQPVRGLRVNGEDARQFVRLGVDHRAAPARDARIVDEDVDRAEIGENSVGEGDNGVVRFHRRRIGFRGDAEGRQRLDGFLRGIGVAAIADRDIRAVFGKRLRDGAADAAPAACHQRGAAFQRPRAGGHAARSNTAAMPCPPPMHMVSRP